MNMIEQWNEHRNIPDRHRTFIEKSVTRLKQDTRILGVAAGGSFLLDEMDEFSDLDLVLYIDPKHYSDLMLNPRSIAQSMGAMIECFTGEHVGEPRLLICLFGPPLLHVDLKFVSMDDIHEKVEIPIVLWERDTSLHDMIHQTPAEFPQPNHSWIEDRFWTWIHYTGTKIGRGELFEAMDSIGFIRSHVLGPLILAKHDARPQGLRKIEFVAAPNELEDLKKTVPSYDSQDCIRALRGCVDLYRQLRNQAGNVQAERLALEYLDKIVTALD